MTTAITKVESITQSIFPNNTMYLVWNIDKKNWFGTYSGLSTLCGAVWNHEELAIRDAESHKVKNYEIVEFSLDSIHQDLIRIYNLSGSFPIREKKQMLISKLTQLIKIQILQSEKLKKIMKEKHNV